MSFKDLLESLQQGTAQIEQRRALGEQALASMIAPTLNGGSGSPVGKGGHRGSGNNSGVHIPMKGVGSNAKDFLRAIATQESGGNYKAVGVPTKYGTAYGKYQILDSNIKGHGGWDREALGRDISVKAFLNHPKLQEKIARAKLLQYFRRYGAEGAAKAWYAGEGNANTDSNSPQYGGPSINAYAASVLSHMRGN